MSGLNGTAAEPSAGNEANRSMLAELEAAYFSAVNQIVEPAVRSGFGSPGILPMGLIVLETKGRRTGRWHRMPVLASVIGSYLLISTVRGRRSHWVRNLGRSTEVQYWSWGRLRSARAILFAPDREPPDLEGLPPPFASLGASLACLATVLGCAFALLVPEDSAAAQRLSLPSSRARMSSEN